MGENEVIDPLHKLLKGVGLKLKTAVEMAVDDEMDDGLIILLAREVPVLLLNERLKRIEEKLEELDDTITASGMGLDRYVE